MSSDNDPLLSVHTKPMGAGRWGHEGLAGFMWEWTLDFHDEAWYSGAGASCENCANVSGEGARVMRGGDFQYTESSLRAAERFAGSAGAAWLGAGVRCAR